MSETLFDEVAQAYSGKAWYWEMLDEPKCEMKAAADIEASLSFSGFLRSACRNPTGVKTTTVFFDLQMSLPESGSFTGMGQAVKDNQFQDLPAALRPKEGFPEDAKLGLVLQNNGNGTYNTLRVMYFNSSVKTQWAKQFANGRPYVLVYRQGGWVVKKTLVALMNRLDGYHITWARLTSTAGPAGLQRSQSQTWNPPNDAPWEGITFININAPECDSRNEQTFWIMKHIKADSESPIAGWPENNW